MIRGDVYVQMDLAHALDKVDEAMYNLALDHGCESIDGVFEWCYENAPKLWKIRDDLNAVLNEWGYYDVCEEGNPSTRSN